MTDTKDMSAASTESVGFHLEPNTPASHLDRGGMIAPAAAAPGEEWSLLRRAGFIAIATFLAALGGIASRPAGLMASWWPVNAMLVSFMLVQPRLRHPLCYAAAFVGMFVADWVTGSTLAVNLGMNASNLVGIVAATLYARRWFRDRDVSLSSPEAVMHTFAFFILTCATTAVAGMFASHHLFGTPWTAGWRDWFASELTNFMAICPVLLTSPRWPWKWSNPLHRMRRLRDREQMLQYGCILLTLGLALAIGGPGAMLFPLPALLWVSVRASVFRTAVLALLSYSALNVFAAMGWLELGSPDEPSRSQVSVQIGLALLAIGPLVVASTTEARRSLVAELHRRATRDSLTGVLTRAAFFEAADLKVNRFVSHHRPVAVLMLDIDHFKSINDTWGHAAGDRVLERFAEIVAGCLRSNDLIGRLGGEEFAIVAPSASEADAAGLGERIRAAVETHPIAWDDVEVGFTVSIGVASADSPSDTVTRLLSLADQALYAAKTSGRNCVRRASGVPGRRIGTTAPDPLGHAGGRVPVTF